MTATPSHDKEKGKNAQPLFFVNGFVDISMISGISLLFAALLYTASLDHLAPILPYWAIFLSYFFAWPHVAMTNSQFYGSHHTRNQFPVTAYLLPFVLLLMVLSAFYYPLLVAPLFIKLFILWAPYHFSEQTLRITYLYAKKAGYPITKAEKSALWAFIFGTFIAATIAAESVREGGSFYGISYPGFGVPLWLREVSEFLLLGGGVFFLVLFTRNLFKLKKFYLLFLLLPAITHYIWFLAMAHMPLFGSFIPVFHGLQYMFIAWCFHLKGKNIELNAKGSLAIKLKETFRFYAINFALGWALFWGLPFLGVTKGFPLALATGIFISAIQIHHFFIDALLWRIRNKDPLVPLT